MGKKVTVKYSVKNRGRTFNGQSRDNVLNIQKLCQYINGGSCQERVKSRDMVGYYGHATREKLGLYPAEGVARGDSPVPEVIPAIVTIQLKAWNDGTIEHTTEFLDTEPGEVSEKLFKSRVGGFSSAIHPTSMMFAGYDYVLSPNYNSNRGYVLDSVNDLTCDDSNFCDAYLLLDDARPALHELEVRSLLDEVAGLKIIGNAMSRAVLDGEALIESLRAANDVLERRLQTETQLKYQASTRAFLDDLRAFEQMPAAAGLFDSAGSRSRSKAATPDDERAVRGLMNRMLRR